MAKQCPTCQGQHDDGLAFCPIDGAPLEPSLPSAPPPSAQKARPQMAPAATVQATEAYDVAALGLAQVPLARSVPPRSLVEPSTQIKNDTLRDILATAPLSAGAAVARIADLAEALALGPCHGALTPSHVRYGADAPGTPTVASASEVEVESGYAARYRAPEFDSATPTTAADVYALGCILFEALTGQPPFSGATAQATDKLHKQSAPPAIRQVRADLDVPPGLEVEVQRSLRKRPGDRHPTLVAWAQAVRRAVRDDDRATVSLGAGEAAFLQQLLVGRSEAGSSQGTGAGATGSRPASIHRAESGAILMPDAKASPLPPPPVSAHPPSQAAASAEGSAEGSAHPDDATDRPRSRPWLGLAVAAAVIAGAASAWLLLASPESAPEPAPAASAAPALAEPAAPAPSAAAVTAAPAPEPDISEPAVADVEEPDSGPSSEAADVASPEPEKPQDKAGRHGRKRRPSPTGSQGSAPTGNKPDGPAVF